MSIGGNVTLSQGNLIDKLEIVLIYITLDRPK